MQVKTFLSYDHFSTAFGQLHEKPKALRNVCELPFTRLLTCFKNKDINNLTVLFELSDDIIIVKAAKKASNNIIFQSRDLELDECAALMRTFNEVVDYYKQMKGL